MPAPLAQKQIADHQVERQDAQRNRHRSRRGFAVNETTTTQVSTAVTRVATPRVKEREHGDRASQ